MKKLTRNIVRKGSEEEYQKASALLVRAKWFIIISILEEGKKKLLENYSNDVYVRELFRIVARGQEPAEYNDMAGTLVEFGTNLLLLIEENSGAARKDKTVQAIGEKYWEIVGFCPNANVQTLGAGILLAIRDYQ
jgi:hypothetical protein